MTLTPRHLAIALALIAVTALPAGASAATLGAIGHTPVPPGVLQHTVTVTLFPAAKNSPLPHKRLADGTFPHDTLRTESWIGASAGRTVTTDRNTHKLVSECAYTLTVSRCFEAGESDRQGNNTAPNGVIFIYPGNPSLLQSWLDVGNAIKSLIGIPRGFKQTGTRTYLGRPAVVLEQRPAPAPGGIGTESATVIADATTFYPLYREDHSRDTNRGLHQHFDQVTLTRLLKVINPKGVRLTLRSHPGAIVKDVRR